jgi:hypothetical protein
MKHNVGVWIDHKTAVIVSTSAGHITTTTLDSDVDARPRYPGLHAGGGEKEYEPRHNLQLDRYFDAVISRVGLPDAVLILGPGEAKVELKARLGRSQARPRFTVVLDTVDKLTEPQIVATVKKHFGIVN